jgi:hypothetical protein
MELLDRYLQAVKKHLPKKKQEDIIAELRVNLESQLEDREAELGRPLSAAEQEAWLKEMGTPLQVAARYQSQQYLIGPTVFPYYRFVLERALLLCLLVYAIVNALLIVLNAPTVEALGAAILRIPSVLLTTAAWITLAFALLEIAVTRHPSMVGFHSNWNPSELPPLEKPEAGKKTVKFQAAVANAVVGLAFLIYLLLVRRHPFLLFGPGMPVLRALPYKLAPVWMTFYWGIIGLNVLQVGWRVVSLVRRKWNQGRIIETFLSKAAGLALLVMLANRKDHVYVVLKNPALDQLRYGETLSAINSNVHLGLSLVVAIVALNLAWDIGQAGVTAYRTRGAQA